MKKTYNILFLFLFVFVCNINADEGSVIPVSNGKVVFSDTITTSLKKEAIKERLNVWVAENMKPTDQKYITGSINDSVNNVISYIVLEFMEIEKNNWVINSIYIQYHLTIKYSDNQCIVTLSRINYTDSLSDINNLIPGEDILIRKKYKRLTFKDASNKITRHTTDKALGIFESLKKNLK